MSGARLKKDVFATEYGDKYIKKGRSSIVSKVDNVDRNPLGNKEPQGTTGLHQSTNGTNIGR